MVVGLCAFVGCDVVSGFCDFAGWFDFVVLISALFYGWYTFLVFGRLFACVFELLVWRLIVPGLLV